MSAPSSAFKVLPTEHKTDGIFEELKEVQRKFDYLPVEQMEKVAERRGLELRDVHAIASYYPHFHLKPPAKVSVKVCDDMSCHLRGSYEMQTALERRFQGANENELSIRNVSCVGRCDHAPALVVNDVYYDGYTPPEAITLIEQRLVGNAKPGSEYRRKQMELACDPYNGEKPYSALREFVQSRDWPKLLSMIKDAGIKGMGGAGYPTHLKWESVRNNPAPEKYLICNADESEPGTIKDRFIMTQLPHLMLEGMVLAGLCVGAKRGYLYIRHEYKEQEEILQQELLHCYQQRLIGKKILGSELSFDITLFVSPGGYICGEETALLEAIEGKRAEPRNKPPFMASVGLWNKPTVINNVETLVFVTAAAAKGAAWFNSCGANGFTGLKFIGITGHVNRPGIYEVPMGTTYSQLINDYAGGIPNDLPMQAFAPSGPSSGYLPASMADLPIDFQTVSKAGSMVGSGAVVVCAAGTCMLDMALNCVRFFRNESCGKCVPCRVGSQKMTQILQNWTRGNYQLEDLPLVEELCHALKQTSICGLGQILPAPIQSVLKYFRTDVEEHLLNHRCPSGVCRMGGAQ